MSIVISRYFVEAIFENLKAVTKYPGMSTSSLRSLRIYFVGSSLLFLKITQKDRLLVVNMTRKLGKTVAISNDQLKQTFLIIYCIGYFVGIGVKRKAIGRQGEPSTKKAKTDRYV